MIELNIVRTSKRPSFPGQFFGNPAFDSKIFHIAGKIVKDYSGGYWEYCEVKEPVESGFMYPKSTNPLMLVNPFSGEEIAANDVLTGMICTSYALMLELERGYEIYRDKHAALTQVMVEYADQTDQIQAYFLMMD